MNDFPDFMKSPANRIATTDQSTPGVEGYVFDGLDGSQMAFWTCSQTASSSAHVHDFDEYMLVVQGCYTLIIERTAHSDHCWNGILHSTWHTTRRGSRGGHENDSRFWWTSG